jgi:hypothetical protein
MLLLPSADCPKESAARTAANLQVFCAIILSANIRTDARKPAIVLSAINAGSVAYHTILIFAANIIRWLKLLTSGDVPGDGEWRRVDQES